MMLPYSEKAPPHIQSLPAGRLPREFEVGRMSRSAHVEILSSGHEVRDALTPCSHGSVLDPWRAGDQEEFMEPRKMSFGGCDAEEL